MYPVINSGQNHWSAALPRHRICTHCWFAYDGACPVAVIGGVVYGHHFQQGTRSVGLWSRFGCGAAVGGADPGEGNRGKEKAGKELGGNHSDEVKRM